MNRRHFSTLLMSVPFVTFPKDRTLRELIEGGRHELRITSYDRTGDFSTFTYYELDKIDPKLYNDIEKHIVQRLESPDWPIHFVELYEFHPNQNLSDTVVHKLTIYRDFFGTYRYRILKNE